MRSGQHLFAVWIADLQSSYEMGQVVVIAEQQHVIRLTRVLRVRPGDELQLFCTAVVLRVRVVAIQAREVRVVVLLVSTPAQLYPKLHLCCPLLERPALTEVMRCATVVGVATIIPIVTEKAHRHVLSGDEIIRLQRVAIAAAEQSKQFTLPRIEQLMPYEEVVRLRNLVWFDGTGAPLSEQMARITECPELYVGVGPEGDLSAREREMLPVDTIKIRLTATTLRTEDACMIGLGALRSLL